MFDLILVPLDGSKRAEAILPHIIALGQCLNSKVLLLQVIEPVLLPYDPQGYMPELDNERTQIRRGEANAYLESIAARLKNEGVEARVQVEEGAVVETILEIGEKEKARLIALASHGRTGLKRAFYGSVADGILNRVACPLLVVRSV